MTIAEIMTREFEVVHEDTPLIDAMRHLRECPLVEDEIGIKCVVVLDGEERLVGVLTQSDVVGEILFPYFVRDLASQHEGTPTFRAEDYRALSMWASKVRVRDVMTRTLVTLPPTADAFEAADTLVSKRVKSIPVLENGKVVGILYRSALFRRIADAILQVAEATESRRPT